MADVLIRGGTVIDPEQGIHDRRDVSVVRGRVEAVAAALVPRPGQEIVEAEGKLVTPGLIDLHVHVFWGVSHYGVEADPACLYRGVTTAVDAGSAGAQTFPGLRRYVIEVAKTRLYAFLNISLSGMLSEKVGELEELRFLDKEAAVRVAEANRDVVQGIKVRLSRELVGENGWAALRLAREAAEAVGMPMMVHVGDTPMPLTQILETMRGGDVLTHCFHGRLQGILDEQGKVTPEVTKAIERGIVFDVGHGRGSFSFDVAKKALAQQVLPGTISSDVHRYNIHGPVYDLTTTMSKFLLLGVPLDGVIRMTTARPAAALGMKGFIGTLLPGASGDVTIMELREGRFTFHDAHGVAIDGIQKLVPVHVIVKGESIPLAPTPSPPAQDRGPGA